MEFFKILGIFVTRNLQKMQALLYNLLSYVFELTFPIVRLVSSKMKLFVDGRKQVKPTLNQTDFTNDDWLWFHCASLGEYEQAVPVIEALKERYKIAVSFFSPSGYEQKKNHHLIDCAFYLPIDTPANATFIIEQIKPKAALFVKYEFWRNYFKQLNQNNIPIYMISAAFRPNQAIFKWYGGFLKNTLKYVTHFFVQNETSLTLLKQHTFTNVSISGDTRFDRVNQQLSMDNTLEFIEDFKRNRKTIVLGSTWPECEKLFIETINSYKENVCFIIAPHEIKPEKIKSLASKLKVPTSIYSNGVNNNDKVLIIDTIGFLTRIYSYADIAYVGGAAGTTGLHNILEPAVFGLPILTGTNTEKFTEAQALEKAGGLQKIKDSEDFDFTLIHIIELWGLREKMSKHSEDFIQNNVGATETIIKYLDTTSTRGIPLKHF